MATNNKQPAIIFDLGGVLIDWNPRHLYRQLFNGNETKMDYFLTIVCSQEWNSKQDAGYPFSQAVADRIKLFPEYEPYIRAYFSRWEEMIKGEIKGTVKLLSNLRDNGYHLYALSNWSAETYPLIYKRFNFLSWFEEVVISGQVKMIKPNASIFNLLLNQINFSAQECLFIDDSDKNIETANRLGFQTIQFYSPDHLNLELCKRGLISSSI